jgi:hypothetical protein
MSRRTGRGWVIATVAALLGGVGAFTGAIVNILAGVNLAAVASAHMGQGTAAAGAGGADLG